MYGFCKNDFESAAKKFILNYYCPVNEFNRLC